MKHSTACIISRLIKAYIDTYRIMSALAKAPIPLIIYVKISASRLLKFLHDIYMQEAFSEGFILYKLR